MVSAVKKIKDDLSNLDVVLSRYDAKLRYYDDKLEINLKTYAEANGEQAGLVAYYCQLSSELEIMAEDMKQRLAQARSRALKKIIRNATREYTDRTLHAMIEDDPDYVKHYKAMQEVKERHQKADDVASAFLARGYALNNFTRIRSAEFQDEIMYVKK
jgi:hypothetical protein